MEETTEPKKLYELGFLLEGDLGEEEARGAHKTLEELVAMRGVITEQGEPIRQVLSYRIGKKRMAYFSWIRFETDTVHILEINNSLRYNTTVIRHLILVLNPKQLKQELRYERRSRESVRPQEGNETIKEEVRPQEKSAEVDIQELDKRLAEIL